MDAVYGELRQMARGYVRRERAGHSLPPTARGPIAVIIRATSRLLVLLASVCLIACQSPPPASAAPPAVEPVPSPVAEALQSPSHAPAVTGGVERYDLRRDEARGGHTIARHVGRSDDQLRERLRDEPRISAASTYTDLGTAERVVARTLARDRARVQKWLARQGPRPNLAIDYRGDRGELVGRRLTRRNPQPVKCSDAVVVLRWNGQRGFFVLTSYPEVSR